MAGKPSIKKRKFTNEFRQEAVRLVIDEGQRVCDTADDLGIGRGVLGRWVREERHEIANPGSRDEAKRLKELEGEVRKLRMERDILKKAMAYFVPDSK